MTPGPAFDPTGDAHPRLVSGDPAIDAVLERYAVTDLDTLTWDAYQLMVEAVQARFAPVVSTYYWDYLFPPELQVATPERLRKPRAARSACTLWGEPHGHAVICLGGVANAARRFDVLAGRLCSGAPVICVDWMGRGESGWLPEQADYGFATYVHQLARLIEHFGLRRVALVGSSLGGSVAMRLAATRPELVTALVLNDVGPFIPAARRSRRAEAIGRHYVFRRPVEMFARSGASQKHDGPVGDAVLLYTGYHQTKWSRTEDGRIYRHDPRALMAYRAVAAEDHVQWHDWQRVRCPVLLIHGMQSDALDLATVERMAAVRHLDVISVPRTGHTPSLCDDPLLGLIARWLRNPGAMGRRVTCAPPLAPPRVLFPQSDSGRG